MHITQKFFVSSFNSITEQYGGGIVTDWIYWISLIASIASIIGLIIAVYQIHQTHKEKTLSFLYVHGANGHGRKLAIFFVLSIASLFAFGLTNYGHPEIT